jgi:hypothetical protein
LLADVVGVTLNGTVTNNLAFGANPGFDPAGLANNGGPTQTIALQTNSAAVDKGSNPAGLTTDQRGGTFVRSSGAGVDIGAFEVQSATSAVTVTSVVVNQGVGLAGQKSEVTKITVNFSGTVTAAASNFTLLNKTVNSNVGTIIVAGSGTNAITLTFGGTNTTTGTAGTSLNDGTYKLTVSGISGLASPFTFDDSGTTSGNQLYRLYGDSDGNRVVNQADLANFRVFFGGTDITFDANLDGVVNQTDLAAFRVAFGGGI